MIFLAVFILTIIYCAARDGSKKRRQRERENAITQARIENERLKAAAIENREREKAEKAKAAQIIAECTMTANQSLIHELQAQSRRIDTLILEYYSGGTTRDAEKRVQLREKQLQLSKAIAKAELQIDKAKSRGY